MQERPALCLQLLDAAEPLTVSACEPVFRLQGLDLLKGAFDAEGLTVAVLGFDAGYMCRLVALWGELVGPDRRLTAVERDRGKERGIWNTVLGRRHQDVSLHGWCDILLLMGFGHGPGGAPRLRGCWQRLVFWGRTSWLKIWPDVGHKVQVCRSRK